MTATTPSKPLCKICGLTKAADAHVAAEHGADFLGFIHYAKSPRHISLKAAETLGPNLPKGPGRVGVFVNESLEIIEGFSKSLALTHVQLHGGEDIEDIRRIKDATGLKLIKVIKVASAEDVEEAYHLQQMCDLLLFDTKPVPGDPLPGGNARAFPWGLLKGQRFEVPTLLAGGLTPFNVAEALLASGVNGVDVSSGVEHKPGEKSHDRIRAFLNAAKSPKTKR